MKGALDIDIPRFIVDLDDEAGDVEREIEIARQDLMRLRKQAFVLRLTEIIKEEGCGRNGIGPLVIRYGNDHEQSDPFTFSCPGASDRFIFMIGMAFRRASMEARLKGLVAGIVNAFGKGMTVDMIDEILLVGFGAEDFSAREAALLRKRTGNPMTGSPRAGQTAP